jgi:hypothetical protein
MSRNGLYGFLAAAFFLGLFYFGISYCLDDFFEQTKWRACIFKNVTGYPCPSCGTTRSVKLLFDGDLRAALLMNPMGLIVGLLMVVIPVLLLYDLIFRRQVLYNSYRTVEKKLEQQKWLAVVLVLLVLANWIWNFKKHL